MGKINDEVSKCYDSDLSFAKAFDEMNKQLEKISSLSESCCDMDTLIDNYESEENAKIMKLDRVRHTDAETGKLSHYIRLLYEDEDGDLAVQCTQEIFDIENMGMMIGIGFIQQIQQLVYIGYRFVQSKTWEETEVKELFIVE